MLETLSFPYVCTYRNYCADGVRSKISGCMCGVHFTSIVTQQRRVTTYVCMLYRGLPQNLTRSRRFIADAFETLGENARVIIIVRSRVFIIFEERRSKSKVTPSFVNRRHSLDKRKRYNVSAHLFSSSLVVTRLKAAKG